MQDEIHYSLVLLCGIAMVVVPLLITLCVARLFDYDSRADYYYHSSSNQEEPSYERVQNEEDILELQEALPPNRFHFNETEDDDKKDTPTH